MSNDQYEYTPVIVEYWLRNWPILEAMIEDPRTAAHLTTRQHTRGGECEEPKGGPFVDLNMICLKADIEYAVARLTDPLCVAVVRYSMAGVPPGEAARDLRKNRSRAFASLRIAARDIAKTLGWDEESTRLRSVS